MVLAVMVVMAALVVMVAVAEVMMRMTLLEAGQQRERQLAEGIQPTMSLSANNRSFPHLQT